MAENITENLVIKKSKMGCKKKLLYLGKYMIPRRMFPKGYACAWRPKKDDNTSRYIFKVQ